MNYKTQSDRKIKRNVFYSKLALHGLTLSALGKMMNPPVGKVRVFEIIYVAAPEYRLKEIAAILKTNVPTLWPKEKKEAA
jgi:hypothetical protein